MQFKYEATAESGKRETGVMEAVSSIVAGHMLKERGLMPVSLKPVGTGFNIDIFKVFKRVKLRDKLVFIQDLEVMLKSGIPLSRSLQVLSKQGGHSLLSEVVSEVGKDVESGLSLNESLGKHPKIFSPIFVSMIKVGELSGSLDLSLAYLKVQLEREAELSSRVRGAMIYPSVVLSVMILAGIVMSMYVLPKLTSIFADFNASLPLATRIIISFSNFVSHHSILVFGVLIILGFGIFRGLQIPAIKKAVFFVSMRLPGIGQIVKEVSLARFCRITFSLMKSGIAVVEALAVVGEAMPNPYYHDALLSASEGVKLGKSMTDVLASYDILFPFLVTQMLSVGEESGAVESILEQMASHYETSVDTTLKNLSSVIEPVLLVVIGSVVGVVAYALIMPIYNIGSQID